MTLPAAQPLKVYTDGSMITSSDDNNIIRYFMGVAWYMENIDISFQCGAIDFPSSTRAELIAIMTSLLTIPIN